MALHTRAPSELRRASPSEIVDTFGHLRRYLKEDRWLGLRNAYSHDTIARIAAHSKTTSINNKHLVEYIAASIPLHAVDGWSYLGRALSSHLIGDVYTARHLAYYAELRAAMCLLATQGIGVFNDTHFVVTSRTSAIPVSGRAPTHVFVWDALKWWATEPSSADVLGTVIRPYQRGLQTWLTEIPAYASWKPQAQNLIHTLGIDLNRVANDKNSRNEASYRPSRMRNRQAVDVRRGAEFAIALWLSLEPAPVGFERLDRHFLRRSFEDAYTSVTGRSPSPTSTSFSSAVDTLLTGNGVTEPRFSLLQGFLCRQEDPDDVLVMKNALVDSKPSSPDHHLHMMSRATLLLTISSLAARSVIHRAAIDTADTKFWWELLGTDRGLWPSHPALDLHEYWDDVQVDLADLQTWLDSGGHQRASLVAECPRSVTRLSQMELVGLWGLAA